MEKGKVMKKCSLCGTENADDKIFCGLCGQRLDTIHNELNNDNFPEVSEHHVVGLSLDTAPTPKNNLCPFCNGSGEIDDVYRVSIACENQEHIDKMREMISTLSDDEIIVQFDNTVNWVELYRKLLADELLKRGHNGAIHDERSIQYDDCADKENVAYTDEKLGEDVPPSEIVGAETIDYNLALMVQQKIAAFSVEETKAALQRLRGIPECSLSEEELAQLHYEIDTCELHLFELTGDVNA